MLRTSTSSSSSSSGASLLSEVGKVDLWTITTIKKHFKLKQFKECIGCIGKQYGTSIDNITLNIRNSQLQEFIISTLIQCYYEIQEYESVHKLFEIPPTSLSQKTLTLYIQFCIKLQLFDKAKELLGNESMKTLPQQERHTLEDYLEREESQMKEAQAITEHQNNFNKLSYMYRNSKFKQSGGAYFAEPQDEDYDDGGYSALPPSTKQVTHKESIPATQSNTSVTQNNQKPSIESQSRSSNSGGLTSLTRYILNFIGKYKVELALQVVSFVLLYWLLK
ncbi:predicted protein [Naegleria gruberi]|uniref:Predicted protein n=1 Tax=Naegleria gruberi TaxID=5762 RepID=D2V2J9_NAEGR|nr:uncharacterized protein NAEGRDRAFT_63024 [Naegleria gruberi]EFC49073.1 predicted protein [Naegleria gruberi]|eukprot:XP_002681817.1 predicted protein [Naegleria gruberi strain NEG-M]